MEIGEARDQWHFDAPNHGEVHVVELYLEAGDLGHGAMFQGSRSAKRLTRLVVNPHQNIAQMGFRVEAVKLDVDVPELTAALVVGVIPPGEPGGALRFQGSRCRRQVEVHRGRNPATSKTDV